MSESDSFADLSSRSDKDIIEEDDEDVDLIFNTQIDVTR